MKMKNQLTNRILSLVLAFVMVTGLLPTMAFAESGKHTVTVNAGEDGQVSTDGTSWSNSVAVTVNDGETLDGKVQYKADEGYNFDGVIPSSKIVSVAAGAGHTVLLDADGNVWTAGSKQYGQLGRTDSNTSTFTQVTVGDGVKIKAIAADYYHTVLLDENGNVWTAGNNYYGQLGRDKNAGTNKPNSTFTKVTVGDGVKIKAIEAGYYHTILLDANDNVWTAGYNNRGQLGRTANDSPNPTFTKVTVGDSVKIKAIAAGYYHTILLDANGNVWTAGYNKYGQLGRDENAGTIKPNSTFKQVTDGISEVKITAIATVRSHTVLLDENNSVWTAGYNEYGQLGRDENAGTTKPNSTFKQVTDGIGGVKITAIAAGSSHTVLLDENNSVWTAGYNYQGQLGRTANNSPNTTFKQAAVNPNAITFEKLLNTPIYNDSVFLVKFKDIQCPVITGLENNKTYCDAVEFTVTDNDGIASVKAGNTELTESNGKYTLEKGVGTVTVVAADKAKNETTITVTVNDGHTYGAWQSNGDDTHTRYCTVTGCNISEDDDCIGGQATYFKKAVCDECNKAYGELLTDKTAPTGEISIGTNKWNSFLNTITFGLFFKNTQSVTITATDDSYNHNGYTDDKAVKVEYLLSDKGLSKTDLADKGFTEYGSAFSINPDNKYVVYVKLTDHAGNVTYISSNGIVLDATAPVITSVTDGAVYYTTQKAVVTDDNLKSVTLNGVIVSGTTVTLDGNTDEVYTIVATDKSDNSTTVTVTMKPISSLAQSIEDINGENVKSSNKEEIDAVKESVGEVDTSNATDSEKEALNDINNRCDELLDIVDEAQKATETENIKNAEKINPDNVTENDRDALENAKADLEKALEDNGGNYTADEKKAIEDEIKRIDDALEVIGNVKAVEELIDKLPENITKNDEDAIKAADDAYNALTDYEKSLVDEAAKKALDDAKAALAELNKPADPNSPATGDNSNMALWIALLFISGGAVITLTVVDRKRRTASKR